MSDRYTVGVDLGAGPDFERVVIVEHPGRVAIVCDRDEARRLAHALLDAIGDRSEAEAIVRDLLATDGDYACHGCGEFRDRPCRPGCAFACARAFVAREGREETDHE